MHDELRNEERMDEEGWKKVADDALDARVMLALEAQPRLYIPTDFAARVASRVAVRRASSLEGIGMRSAGLRSTRYGYAMGWVSMVVLLIAILACAPHAVAGSTLGVGLEWILCAQFVLLAVWFGLRRERLRLAWK